MRRLSLFCILVTIILLYQGTWQSRPVSRRHSCAVIRLLQYVSGRVVIGFTVPRLVCAQIQGAPNVTVRITPYSLRYLLPKPYFSTVLSHQALRYCRGNGRCHSVSEVESWMFHLSLRETHSPAASKRTLRPGHGLPSPIRSCTTGTGVLQHHAIGSAFSQ